MPTQHPDHRSVPGSGYTSAGMAAAARALATEPVASPEMTADRALELLKEGNRRFLQDRQEEAAVPMGAERRLELARSQSPFAVLVSCSDSRVPPELLFGRGLGELFIVRNAGNTVDTIALGSIEYAVHALMVPLVVVLGHQRCGAVAAAVSVVEDNAVFPGSLGQMVEPIIPAVLQARTRCGCAEENLLDAAVRANVERIVARLKTSEPILMDPLRDGTLRIVGAHYDLEQGHVEFFDD
jgi:carbonic anhydrase